MTVALPETFRCISLGCTLTRSSCGARHLTATCSRRWQSATPRAVTIAALRACSACEVGAAHARGERPDVTIASVVARAEATGG